MRGANPSVDAYINNAAEFARPILSHLRALVHQACPDVEETIKWGFPHFEYRGIICSMASFKAHCSFGFWKGILMRDEAGVLARIGETAMSQLERLESKTDLPDDRILLEYILEAVELNERDVKVPEPPVKERKTLEVPADLLDALGNSPEAQNTFDNFSPSNQREYVEWITGAKTESTRQKRLATAIEWMKEGKSRNWKYMKK